MKTALSAAILAGALLASQGAYAGDWEWGITIPKTISNWMSEGPIVDGDNDMRFTWGGLSGDLIGRESDIGVQMREVEIGGEDFYTIGFDFNAMGGYRGNGGDIWYTMDAFANERIYSARLDTDVAAGVGEIVREDLYNSPGLDTKFLTLISENGKPDPEDGHFHFGGKVSIKVENTLFANGSIIDHLDNEFDTVPEPMPLSLIALGFVLLNLFRRNSVKVSAS
ncbi:hypothetical protein NP603_06880 [Methylomonas sp. SURF-1]|uniref:PEP-CTERM protein-sorting domain-containing protein n=1 Tax=Methylomonas aurea TaxID=2952224 RepID=A0ABT1UF13_9GAMM|nr:hypothetical protein [Methylomonas sp. SURF-1]MCQ8180825.1 hypothetical protein [Methylomonas sp. SURF-1]